jgi:hypothetical protein
MQVFGERLQEEFTPMRLYGKWSKGISLVYLVLADFRDVNQSKNMRDKIAQQVHLKWEDIYTQSNFWLTQSFLPTTSRYRSTSAPNTSKKLTSNPEFQSRSERHSSRIQLQKTLLKGRATFE